MSGIERMLRGVFTARGRRSQLIGVTVANLLPVGGVVLLGWDAVTLLTLYWLELAVTGAFAFGRSVFHPPQNVDEDVLFVGPLATREVTVPVPLTRLRVHLATVLLLPVLVCVFGFVWVTTAGFIFAPIGVPGDEALTNATLGAFCTAGTTAVGTVVDTPSDRDAQTAMVAALSKTGSVFLAGIVTVTLVGVTTGGPDTTIGEIDGGAVTVPLLLAVVCVKYVVNLGVLYHDRLRASIIRVHEAIGPGDRHNERAHDDEDHAGGDATGSGGNATESGDEAGTREFDCRVRPTRRARLLGGVVRAASHPSVIFIGFFGVSIGGLFAGSDAWSLATTILGVTAVVVTVFVGADTLLHGSVEYRVGDGRVIAYDTSFGKQLWCVEVWDERALRVERGRLDRLLGTETLVIVLPETERRLPQLPTTDTVLAAFERQVKWPEE